MTKSTGFNFSDLFKFSPASGIYVPAGFVYNGFYPYLHHVQAPMMLLSGCLMGAEEIRREIWQGYANGSTRAIEDNPRNFYEKGQPQLNLMSALKEAVALALREGMLIHLDSPAQIGQKRVISRLNLNDPAFPFSLGEFVIIQEGFLVRDIFYFRVIRPKDGIEHYIPSQCLTPAFLFTDDSDEIPF